MLTAYRLHRDALTPYTGRRYARQAALRKVWVDGRNRRHAIGDTLAHVLRLAVIGAAVATFLAFVSGAVAVIGLAWQVSPPLACALTFGAFVATGHAMLDA